MRASRSLLPGIILLLAGAGARAEDGDGRSPAALAAAVRNEDAGRRREALKAILLRARTIPSAEEARVRTALEELLPREPDAEARALATAALARLGGEASLAPLLRALAVEEQPAPQDALVDAFGDLPPASAAAALSRVAFGTQDPREGALAAEALGRVAGDAALQALLALAGTTHPWPEQAAVLRGLSLRADPRAADEAVKALRNPDPAVKAAAREAAAALIGEDLGDDPAAWEKRWAGARAAWIPPGSRQAPPAKETETLPSPKPETRTVARFYDLPVTGRRVVFVVDCSQSMWGPKMETAKAETEAAVKGLRSTQRFAAVFFNEKTWTWRDVLVRATPAQKWAFVRTLPDLPTKSYTNISDALERVFGWAGVGRWAVPDPPGLDEVFFLTDGFPNRGRFLEPDRIAEAVRGWNSTARARIHTVAVGDRTAPELLERLSADSGGRTTKR
jgi:hypothetical protein